MHRHSYGLVIGTIFYPRTLGDVLIRNHVHFLTVHKEERRKAPQLLGEIEAVERRSEDGPSGRTERDSPVVRAGGA